MATLLLIDASEATLTKSLDGSSFKEILQKGNVLTLLVDIQHLAGVLQFLDWLEKHLPSEHVALATYASKPALLQDFTQVAEF